MNLLHS
jgi:hypothetical protein